MISADTQQAVLALVAQCDSLRSAAKVVCIHHAVLADILNERHAHVSRQSEQRVRRAFGLPPLPALVPVDPCPDCGSVHHARCNGNSGPVVVLGSTERVIKRGGAPQRKRYRWSATTAQERRRAALNVAGQAVIEAGLKALEGRQP